MASVDTGVAAGLPLTIACGLRNWKRADAKNQRTCEKLALAAFLAGVTVGGILLANVEPSSETSTAEWITVSVPAGFMVGSLGFTLISRAFD